MTACVSFYCCDRLCTVWAIASACVSTAEDMPSSLTGLREIPLHPSPAGCSHDGALWQGKWARRALGRVSHLSGAPGHFSTPQVWREGEPGSSVSVTLQTGSPSAPPPLPTQVWCFHLSKYHNSLLHRKQRLSCALSFALLPGFGPVSAWPISWISAREILCFTHSGAAWLDYASYSKLIDQS